MRFYVDECLSRLTVEFLRRRRHNTVYATELGFIGKGDAFHYARAREMNRILVTRDGDFSNPLEYPFAKHPGVINIDLGPRADTDDANEALARLFRTLKPSQIKGTKITLRTNDIKLRKPASVEIIPYRK